MTSAPADAAGSIEMKLLAVVHRAAAVALPIAIALVPGHAPRSAAEAARLHPRGAGAEILGGAFLSQVEPHLSHLSRRISCASNRGRSLPIWIAPAFLRNQVEQRMPSGLPLRAPKLETSAAPTWHPRCFPRRRGR